MSLHSDHRFTRTPYSLAKPQSNVGRLEVDPASLGKAFRSDLTALVKAAQQHARVVAVATFSTRLRPDQSTEQQVEASASALYYMRVMTPAGLIASYARYNEIIREVAASTGALLDGNENDIPGDGTHFADSVHFTDAGSQPMAIGVFAASGPYLARAFAQ